AGTRGAPRPGTGVASMSATPVAAPAAAGVARGGAANLAGAAFAGLAGFGVTWLAARALGPVQAGGFFAATAAFTLAGTVAKLGTPTGLVYFLARLRARDASATALRQCVRTGVVPVAAASVVAAAVLWFAAAPAYATQSRVLAVFLPVAVLCDTLLAATRGCRRMRAAALYAVASRFLVFGQMVNQALLLAVQPRLAELLGTKDRAGASTLYRTATAWLILAVWPVYLGTAVFASVYLGLFGSGYRAG